jgi:hypothetical protein
MNEAVSEFPLYLSPSQVSSLGTCGEQFRLTRVVRAPERPQWAGIGGSAVHRMTEDADLAAYNSLPFTGTWDDYWAEALDETKKYHPEFSEDEYYTGGRASKAWPDKEGPAWWAENGPKFVESWRQWLDASGFEIWDFPNAEGTFTPAIELETWAENGDLYLKSVIDRILLDPTTGVIYIVDLKSGSHTAAWPQQMALNNVGFKQHAYACPTENGAQFAGFWKARQGGVMKWFPLDYPDDWLWDQVRMAKAIRDQHLFVAQPSNLCASACGVRQHCVAMGGTPFFPVDATLTQSRKDASNR